jgi:glycosyltransferase involved in cell wall biosynthesis
MQKQISIVCPMKNEALLLSDLCKALEKLTSQIYQRGYIVEVIFMDNASSDNTKEFMENYINSNDTKVNYRYIRNNRDIGLQASLMTSMEIAKGDAFIVLHSDLEDPPQLIIDFIKSWENGNKTVVGVMETRSDPLLYQWSSKLFYRLLKITSDQKVVADFTDFFLIDRSIYKDIAQRPRTNQYIRGIISANYGIGERISYQRLRRKAGKSNFNFAKRYEVALDAIFALGTRLPRYFSIFSTVLFFGSLLMYFILPFGSVFGAKLDYSTLALVNLITLILLGLAMSLEILFRIYNFLLNSSKEYSYEEYKSKE